MKKRIAILAMVLWTTFGISTTVYAEDANKTVALTKDNSIEYVDGNGTITDAFDGMAPGDTKTVVIRVENNNSHTASFFISQETMKALEDGTSASGGAYTYQLAVGSSKDSATVLLDTVAGGYTGSSNSGYVANTAGLGDIEELEGYQFLDELADGEYTNVYLTLSIDGEGFDNAYANAVGELEFNFRAYYEDKEPQIITQYVTQKGNTNVITEIIEQLVPLSAAKTGDIAGLGIFIGVLVIGIVLVLIAIKKRKVEHEA